MHHEQVHIEMSEEDNRRKYIEEAREDNVEFRLEAGIDLSSALSRPTAREAYRRLQFSIENSALDPNCKDRELEFVNYNYKGRPGNRAEDMCRGCPFLQQCADYAKKERPTWTVLGGKDWSTYDPENPTGE